MIKHTIVSQRYKAVITQNFMHNFQDSTKLLSALARVSSLLYFLLAAVIIISLVVMTMILWMFLLAQLFLASPPSRPVRAKPE